MGKIEDIINGLTAYQKEIIKKANEPNSTILFNIKGMIQVLHEEGPYDFIEMGYEDIEALKKKGLITLKSGQHKGDVLHGEEYILSPVGIETAKRIP